MSLQPPEKRLVTETSIVEITNNILETKAPRVTEYDPELEYLTDDFVLFEKTLWRATEPSTGVTPGTNGEPYSIPAITRPTWVVDIATNGSVEKISGVGGWVGGSFLGTTEFPDAYQTGVGLVMPEAVARDEFSLDLLVDLENLPPMTTGGIAGISVLVGDQAAQMAYSFSFVIEGSVDEQSPVSSDTFYVMGQRRNYDDEWEGYPPHFEVSPRPSGLVPVSFSFDGVYGKITVDGVDYVFNMPGERTQATFTSIGAVTIQSVAGTAGGGDTGSFKFRVDADLPETDLPALSSWPAQPSGDDIVWLKDPEWVGASWVDFYGQPTGIWQGNLSFEEPIDEFVFDLEIDLGMLREGMTLMAGVLTMSGQSPAPSAGLQLQAMRVDGVVSGFISAVPSMEGLPEEPEMVPFSAPEEDIVLFHVEMSSVGMILKLNGENIEVLPGGVTQPITGATAVFYVDSEEANYVAGNVRMRLKSSIDPGPWSGLIPDGREDEKGLIQLANAEEIALEKESRKAVSPKGLANLVAKIPDYVFAKTYPKNSAVMYNGALFRANIKTSVSPIAGLPDLFQWSSYTFSDWAGAEDISADGWRGTTIPGGMNYFSIRTSHSLPAPEPLAEGFKLVYELDVSNYPNYPDTTGQILHEMNIDLSDPDPDNWQNWGEIRLDLFIGDIGYQEGWNDLNLNIAGIGSVSGFYSGTADLNVDIQRFEVSFSGGTASISLNGTHLSDLTYPTDHVIPVVMLQANGQPTNPGSLRYRVLQNPVTLEEVHSDWTLLALSPAVEAAERAALIARIEALEALSVGE